MIVYLRNRKPFVHFGFNRQEIDLFTGEEITVYQDTLYNDDYIFNWNYAGGVLVSENKNELKVKFNSVAIFDLSFDVTTPFGEVISSDVIIGNCKFVTADTKRITADSNDVSADGGFI